MTDPIGERILQVALRAEPLRYASCCGRNWVRIMWNFLWRLLDSSIVSPHGICLSGDPEPIWLHVASDALIALAYFSIPFALAIFVAKRRDLLFGSVYWAFCIFTTAGGLAHVLSIYTLWVPICGIEGLVKAATAAASIVTAAALWL